ncbi:DNA polymerase III subunits gamma and tau [Bacteroides pyogenes JCM 6292]|nr:DNA polymerase III subunits gamma and tau [Bacteroides pyogenes JCM 6292]
MKADALPSEKVSAAASSVEAPSKVYRTVAASSVDAGDSSVVKENRKVPRMKISTLGMSIKNPQREEPAPAAPADIRKVDSEPEEDFIFNERDLNYYWQEYAGSLPMEQVAIAKRMQVLRPVLLRNSTTFEVVVDNEIAAKDFTALIPELQTYLRGRLKNSKVVMKVRVSASTENVLPVGRVEKFQMMARKNQSLMQLKEEFGLELY